MRQNKTPRNLALISCFSLVVVLGLTNWIYMSSCVDLFKGDSYGHLLNSIYYSKGDFNVYTFQTYKSHGLYFLTKILYHLFYIDEKIAISTNLLLAFPLFLATFFIAFRIIKDVSISLFSVVLLFLYPITFGLSRFYMMEFALMSLVTIFIAFLLYSDGFKDKKFSLLAGLTLGLGPSFKESFLLYVFAPLIYEICLLFKHKLLVKRKGNVFIFIIAALVCMSPWFFLRINEIVKTGLGRITLGANNTDIPLFSVKNFLFYLYPLIDFSISPFFSIIFLLSLLPFLKSRVEKKQVLFLWILFPYLHFSFFPWKLARYLSPLAPPVAIITALGLAKFNPIFRRFIYGAALLFGLVQFTALTYDVPLNERYFIETGLMAKIFSSDPSRYREDFWIRQPNKDNTGGLIALKTIAEITANYHKNKISICRFLNRTRKTGNNNEEVLSWIENPLSSSIEFYNLSKNYNYTIDHGYIKDGDVIIGPRQGSAALEKLGHYDVILAFVPVPLEYINPVFSLVRITEEVNSYQTRFYIYLNKSILNEKK